MLMAFGGAVLDHKNTTISKQLSTNLQALYPDCENMSFVAKRIERAPLDKSPFLYAVGCLLKEKRLTTARKFKISGFFAGIIATTGLIAIPFFLYDDHIPVTNSKGEVILVHKEEWAIGTRASRGGCCG